MQARFDERRMQLVYRKGERPLAKEVRPYTCDHPVFQMIQRGDPWLRAWVVQMCRRRALRLSGLLFLS